jgi:hypothetical protein
MSRAIELRRYFKLLNTAATLAGTRSIRICASG